MFYRLTDAPHERAFNTLTLDPANGQVKSDQRYSDRSSAASCWPASMHCT
ncbi:hypothetical protein P4234_11115 [Pseudomonas aeruginosa]|nr:hypothetical protein [Pseudomonas aeruginosa]